MTNANQLYCRMGKGNDEEAVRVVHEVARRNGKTSSLTLADLQACERIAGGDAPARVQTSAAAALKRNLQKIDASHIRSLFATKKLAFSTSLITLIWAFIGLG
jgi:hypothetical protein